MRIVPVPCLKDNYAYLLVEGGDAIIVDPSEAAPVEEALARAGAKLVAIWATHHHPDHVGGIGDLLEAHPGIEVTIGAQDADKVPLATRTLAEGDLIELGAHQGRVIHNPGHTLGAVSYVIDGNVFTGDTMFAAGCGRIFEGDAAMMHDSLTRLAALPADTRVYFGHEYTANNLRFAAAVEPGSAAIAARAGALPAQSTPSTIDDERATNVFLRATEPEVIAAAKTKGAAGDPVSVFAALRAWKDSF
ncbi:MAG TPA: hydroxyacylglutathione hydrolase [Kofleriaceae bacterium]|jgi:hydroxyacylglutathione hydrolase